MNKNSGLIIDVCYIICLGAAKVWQMLWML